MAAPAQCAQNYAPNAMQPGEVPGVHHLQALRPHMAAAHGSQPLKMHATCAILGWERLELLSLHTFYRTETGHVT